MESGGELTLATPRLILRDFNDEDLPDVHGLRSDPDVARFMDFNPETIEQSRTWLGDIVFHNQQRPRQAYNLAVVLRAGTRVIGWIGLGRSERYSGEGELGVGYMVARPYWGQGYAPEALRAMISFGFTMLAGQRISAWCFKENGASARVMEKGGLHYARQIQQMEPKSGQAVDCLEYEIRAAEWQAIG